MNELSKIFRNLEEIKRILIIGGLDMGYGISITKSALKWISNHDYDLWGFSILLQSLV